MGVVSSHWVTKVIRTIDKRYLSAIRQEDNQAQFIFQDVHQIEIRPIWFIKSRKSLGKLSNSSQGVIGTSAGVYEMHGDKCTLRIRSCTLDSIVGGDIAAENIVPLHRGHPPWLFHHTPYKRLTASEALAMANFCNH